MILGTSYRRLSQDFNISKTVLQREDKKNFQVKKKVKVKREEGAYSLMQKNENFVTV